MYMSGLMPMAKRGCEARALDRRIVLLALPALGSIAAEPLYNLADTAIVGRLGRGDLDALAIAGTAMTLVGWIGAFLTTVTTSAVARHTASGDVDAARRSAGAAYAAAAVLGTLAIAVIWPLAPFAARALGGESVMSLASGYLRLASLGLPFLFVAFAGAGHLTGLANLKTPLRIVVVANVANVALEIGLVFGAHLALRGSALGTVAAQLLAAACYLVCSWRTTPSGSPLRPSIGELRALLRDGLHVSVRTLAVGGVPVLATAAAARLGPGVLAGHQIALRLWLMLAMAVDALAVPAQVYVSDALGRGDPATAVATGARVLRLGLFSGAVLGALTLVGAFTVPPLLSGDPAVRHAAWLALLVGAALQPLAAVAFVLDGIVLGLGDYVALRNAMLLASVLFVPIALLVANDHRLGIGVLWGGLGVWLAARAMLLRARWCVLRNATADVPPGVASPSLSTSTSATS
jgi:putative MATE family efflux protein